MPDFIPASPREITPEWATDTMRAAGVLERGRVASVTVRSLSDAGTGFTGDTVRLELDYVDGDGPATAIAKFPTGDRQTRGMLETFDAYAREIRFYRSFASRVPCDVPAYLGADFDEKGARTTGPVLSKLVDALPDRVQLAITRDVTKFMRASARRYALLIEDLGAATTVHDMTAPPSPAQLEAVLDALAAVHAGFWGDGSLAGDPVFRPVLTTTPGLYQTVGRKRCLPMARDRWSEWFSDQHAALLHESLDRYPDDVDRINEPVTLIHGDPRADNLLFRDDGRVVLLDWALVGHAHPGFDVGYLLCSCLPVAQASLRNDLVEHYETVLSGHGITTDPRALREVVDATYRAIAVQQLVSIAVLNNESYGDDSMYDLWMPRILAGLAEPW